MARIEPLISGHELKTDLLRKLAQGAEHPLFVQYDSVFDALMVLVASPHEETVVHYVDQANLALLFQAETLEIVGLQIEDFRASFLPVHAAVRRFWGRNNVGAVLGDLNITDPAHADLKRDLARLVINATRRHLGGPGKALAAVLNQEPSPADGQRTISKAELVARIAQQTGVARAETARVIDAMIDQVTAALSADERVNLPRLGTFEVQKSPQQVGINPRTGARIIIPSTDQRPAFNASPSLMAAVRGQKHRKRRPVSKR